jgi:type I restriction-modification system DNA methylase subunit
MRKDAGLNGDLDRIPEFSWILFLKCFDDMERRREVTQKNYRAAIRKPFRWRDWAADPNKGMTGDELLKFVNDQLFPSPARTGGRERRTRPAGRHRRSLPRNLHPIPLGYILRDVVNLVNSINFNTADDIHTMAHLYESRLKEMRDSAGDSGEFYTPRPVIRFIVQMVQPQLGDTIFDPACGTGGFLVEAYELLKKQVKSKQERERLQYHTLRGVEKKPMPYGCAQRHGRPGPLPEGRKTYTKTQPLRFEEFADCIAWWGTASRSTRKENDRAWRVPVERVIENGFNLDIKNPNAKDDFEHLPPEQLAADILQKEQRIAEMVAGIQKALLQSPKP